MSRLHSAELSSDHTRGKVATLVSHVLHGNLEGWDHMPANPGAPVNHAELRERPQGEQLENILRMSEVALESFIHHEAPEHVAA